MVEYEPSRQHVLLEEGVRLGSNTGTKYPDLSVFNAEIKRELAAIESRLAESFEHRMVTLAFTTTRELADVRVSA